MSFLYSDTSHNPFIVGIYHFRYLVYTDRATCPIFGDGAAAFMVEPTTEDYGIMDSILRTDGKGLKANAFFSPSLSQRIEAVEGK